MPALLTRTSTEPNVFSPSAIISAISACLVMSAGEWTALTLKSFSMLDRSFSMSAGAPIRQSNAAGRSGHHRGLACQGTHLFTLLFVAEGFGAVPRKVIGDHGFV